MADKPIDEPPFEGGAQPVREQRPEVPSGGRTAAQMAVLIIAVLAILAAVLWFAVPFG
ncbi:MAG: hypothetical protein WD737_03725 [Gemmatimonadota bacterium]